MTQIKIALFKKLLFILVITIFIQGCAAVVVAGAAGGAMVANDRRTTGLLIEDENIELKFSSRLSENSELNEASHVNAISYNGVVLLLGQTPQNNFKNQIGEIARKIPNVKRVHNEIRLSAPNSIMTRSSDSYITSKIKTQMTLEKNFSSSAVKVITENGEVFLMGLVSREEAKLAIAITKSVDGIQKIIDVFEYIP